jgi:thiol:disulfide interchange protein DsbD
MVDSEWPTCVGHFPLPFYHSVMITLAAVLLCCVATAFTSAQEQPPTPIRWAAEQPSEGVKAGQRIHVQVSAVIDEGWHLYALDAVEGGPIPTRITAGPVPAFALQEKDIIRSEPKRAHDPNFGIETAYYEESTTFGLPIAVSRDLAAGERELEITARFQACNESICLRPQAATLKVTLTVRK